MKSRVARCEHLTCGYGEIAVLREISLEVRAGEIVLLLGANGAGKTTLVRALSGQLRPTAGEVEVLGEGYAPLHELARRGLALVPDDRGLFGDLSVRQNLRLAGKTVCDDAVAIAPELGGLLGRRAGLLSGGEQQMLTVARAIAGRPRFLIADEASFGLAPRVAARVMDQLRSAADAGTGMLVVEQHVRAGLRIADRGYVVHGGRVVEEGTASELRARLGQIEATYLTGHPDSQS